MSNDSLVNNSKPLRIGVNTYGWFFDLFEGNDQADDSLRFIRECGFEAIDYNFEYFLPPDKLRRGELKSIYDLPTNELLRLFSPIKEASQKHGISIAQGHGPYPLRTQGSEDFDDRVLAAIQKILEVCRYLSCPALVLHAERPWDLERNMKFFRRLIPSAVDTGTKICFENLFIIKKESTDPYCDPISACRYIDMLNEEAGADVFGFCYDIGHANITGRNLCEDICALGHRLTALHIHDNDGSNDQHLIPFTQKHPQKRDNRTDWEGLIEGLCHIKYKGTVSFETHCALTDTPRDLVPNALRFISSIGHYFRERIENK